MRNTLLALLMGLLLGTLIGAAIAFKIAASDVKDAHIQVLSEAVTEAPKAVQVAQDKSVEIQTKVEAIKDDTHTYQRKVARHVPTRAPEAVVSGPGIKVGAPAEPRLAYADDRLSDGAVCLLDAAREGEDPDRAAGRCDEAGDAASAVGVGQLVDADIDAVGRYNALMLQHNELIDYVEDLQRKSQE